MIRTLSFLLCLCMVAVFANCANAGGITYYVGKVSPFTMQENDGTVRGAAVDMVRLIMEKVGSPVADNDMLVVSWARAVEDTETTPGTALFCLARTAPRETRFKWAGPIATLKLGLVARKRDKLIIHAPSDILKYKVSVIRNSAPAQILMDEYDIPYDSLTFLKDDELQFKMLTDGRVDLIAQADVAAPDWIRRLDLNQADYEMVHVIKQLDLYLAFNKQTGDAFVAQVQAALDDLKKPGPDGRSRYDAILAKYLKNGPIAFRKN